jgi:hypothetical protein
LCCLQIFWLRLTSIFVVVAAEKIGLLRLSALHSRA